MLFSIIVPIFKVEKYLEQCINSILNQDFEDYELILVDDGSPDKCAEICDRYAKVDVRVKVIHKENGGLVSARNRGLEIAEGKYINYIDGDDWIEPGLFQAISDAIKTKDVDVVCFNRYLNYPDRQEERPQSIKGGLYNKNKLISDFYPTMLYEPKGKFYTFGIMPSVWSKFVKLEIAKESFCRDEKISFGEDVATSYRWLLKARVVYVLESYYYHYRCSGDSMTKTYHSGRFDNNAHLIEYLRSTLDLNTYNLKYQLDNYIAFLVLQNVVNESRAKGSCKERAEYTEKCMEKYNMQTFVTKFDSKDLPLSARCFFIMAKHKMYKLLIRLCSILLDLK